MITGIDKVLAKVEEMKKELPFVMANLMKEVAKYGQERALMYLNHYDTGATYASVDYEYTPTSATVRAGGAAIWIEFGTGVTKAGYPLNLPPGIVAHGEYGKGQGANPNGWWYPSDTPMGANYDADMTEYTYSGTYLVHTMGMDSNPFMTEALYDMIKFLEERGAKVVMKGLI